MLGEEANTPLMLVKEVLTVGFQFVSSRKDSLQTLLNWSAFGKYKEHVQFP